jgi:glycosyltransferase involved in cell wall biosynthesis
MRIALIGDAFPPLRSSGAVQLRDLSREFVRQGHSLCVLLPAPDQREPWKLENFDGAQLLRLKAAPQSRQLNNTVFFNEIDPDEIPDFYAQWDAGIVALDPRHKSHNIPSKYLTYMQSGPPVLANINAGNDLAQMIRDEQIGQVCETNQVDDLLLLKDKLLDQIGADSGLSARCVALFEREFAVENTVKQIVAALSSTQAGWQ